MTRQQFVYVIQDKDGVPFQDVLFSRSEARRAKNFYEQASAESLKIVRYTVDRSVR